MGDVRRGQFPSPLANVVPHPEATVKLAQYETLPRNTSDFNRGIGRCAPTPLIHGHLHGDRGYAARSQSWTD